MWVALVGPRERKYPGDKPEGGAVLIMWRMGWMEGFCSRRRPVEGRMVSQYHVMLGRHGGISTDGVPQLRPARIRRTCKSAFGRTIPDEGKGINPSK